MADLAEEALRRYAVAYGGNPHHFGKMAWDSYSGYLLAHGEALARGYLALLAERDRLREALEDIAFWRCGCGATWASDKASAALAQPPKPEPAEGT
jgi:hypothetical protein